jgi:hypothetical protein
MTTASRTWSGRACGGTTAAETASISRRRSGLE